MGVSGSVTVTGGSLRGADTGSGAMVATGGLVGPEEEQPAENTKSGRLLHRKNFITLFAGGRINFNGFSNGSVK